MCGMQELVPTSDGNLVRSLMYLFSMLLHEAVEEEKAARENKNLKTWIVVCVYVCIRNTYMYTCTRVSLLVLLCLCSGVVSWRQL